MHDGSRTGSGGDTWFAAQLKPNGIGVAARNLDRQGFVHVVPRLMTARRAGGRIVQRAEPVFPGYVFVRFDPARPGWQAINATQGISRLLTVTAHVPAPMPPGFMAALLARCDAAGLLDTAEDLQVGDRVEMIDGPFATLVGRIATLDRDGRVRVMMDLLGRATRVSATPDQLRRVV